MAQAVTILFLSKMYLPKKVSRFAVLKMFNKKSELDLKKRFNELQFEWILRYAIENHNGRYSAEIEEQMVSALTKLVYAK